MQAALGTAVAFNWNTIPDKLKNVWESIKSGLKNFLNWFIEKWESFINLPIQGINYIIESLNKLSFDVPDWIPIPGLAGKKFGFNISQIPYKTLPRLAKGAVIPPNREFLAVLGDQKSGVNIETPLDTMIQAFKKALDDMGITGNDQPINVQVFIGNEQIDSHVIRVVRRSGLAGNGRVLA